MISIAAATQRMRANRNFAAMAANLENYSPRSFGQLFGSISSGQTSAPLGMNFPTGTVILGVTAGAFIPSVAATPAAQAGHLRQAFGLNFSFANESLTPGGPVQAEALLGSGEDTIFPVRELVVPPGQSIVCTVANYSTSTLSVHVVYHCLAARGS